MAFFSDAFCGSVGACFLLQSLATNLSTSKRLRLIQAASLLPLTKAALDCREIAIADRHYSLTMSLTFNHHKLTWLWLTVRDDINDKGPVSCAGA